jgi:hypothetical protein
MGAQYLKMDAQHLNMDAQHLNMGAQHLKMDAQHLCLLKQHLNMLKQNLYMRAQHLNMDGFYGCWSWVAGLSTAGQFARKLKNAFVAYYICHSYESINMTVLDYGNFSSIRPVLTTGGLIALGAFWLLVASPPIGVTVLTWVEFLLLMVLGVETFIYADLGKGR